MDAHQPEKFPPRLIYFCAGANNSCKSAACARTVAAWSGMTCIKPRAGPPFYPANMNAQMSRKQSRRIFDLIAGGVVVLIVVLGLARSRPAGSPDGANPVQGNLPESLVVQLSTNMVAVPQAY